MALNMKIGSIKLWWILFCFRAVRNDNRPRGLRMDPWRLY